MGCIKIGRIMSTFLPFRLTIFNINKPKSFHTDVLNITMNRLQFGSSGSMTLFQFNCKYIHNIRSCNKFKNPETHRLTTSQQRVVSTQCQGNILLQKLTPFCHQQSRYFSSSCHRNAEIKPLKVPVKSKFCRHLSHGHTTNTAQTQTVIKKRPRPKSKHTELTGNREVIAYSTAEEYDFESLKYELVDQGLYNITNLPFDLTDVIHVTPKYIADGNARDIFFFREGSVVFWEVTENERDNVLTLLKRHGKYSFEIQEIHKELEWLSFKETTQDSDLVKGVIQLNKTVTEEENVLEKYSFSHALSQSAQLNMWEDALDKFIDENDDIARNLQNGKKVRLSKAKALQKLGHLFQLRHSVNLTSDLLDTPDFYWDRENLEKLYQKCYTFLEVRSRTRVMNSKLNYCVELMDLVNDKLNDRHHVNLEIMIILLILVEVVFEVVAYWRNYNTHRENALNIED